MAEAPRRVLVVGASAAGLRCACRLARLRPDWAVAVVEAREVFSYAACGLPYVLSGDIGDLAALRRTDYWTCPATSTTSPPQRASRCWPDAGRPRSTSRGRSLRSRRARRARASLPWDELVLATGAAPRRLPDQPDHPRVVAFHAWEDVKPLKQALARGELERVAIVGAGLVGCELAEAFRTLWGAEVPLLEAAAAPLPGLLDPESGAAAWLGELTANGVELLLRRAGGERSRPDETGVRLRRRTDASVEAEVAIVAVGVEPVVELARRGRVDAGRRAAPSPWTSGWPRRSPHVWAVGRLRRGAARGDRRAGLPAARLPGQPAGTHAGQHPGRTARTPSRRSPARRRSRSSTGTSRRWAAPRPRPRARGIAARSVWITRPRPRHYWPEAQEIHLKLVYDPASRRVLGVQAVGRGRGGQAGRRRRPS